MSSRAIFTSSSVISAPLTRASTLAEAGAESVSARPTANAAPPRRVRQAESMGISAAAPPPVHVIAQERARARGSSRERFIAGARRFQGGRLALTRFGPPLISAHHI